MDIAGAKIYLGISLFSRFDNFLTQIDRGNSANSVNLKLSQPVPQPTSNKLAS